MAGSHTIVEQMRAGRSPEEACLEALKRVAESCEPRLRDKEGRPSFDLCFYAVSKDGEYGAATFFSRYHSARFAVCDAKGPRHEEGATLFKS